MRGIGITAAMVAIETIEVSLSTIMKAAMSRGMSQFVFMLYSNAVGVFVLLPTSFLFYRKRPRPQLTLSIVSKLFLLSIICLGIQVFFNTGIKYSSPTLCTAITDLTPAFTFLLAIISRTEKVALRLASGQAKAMGTIVSVAGALIVTLYKGQPITIFPSESGSQNFLQSPQSNWILGGFLCGIGALCLSLLYIVQAWVVKEFPAELMITTVITIFITVWSTILTLIAESDPSVWILKPDIELVSIICSGIFAVSLRTVVHTWAVHKKGPLYTSMFKPVGMIIATLLGVTFLGDILHIGSVIGGIIIAVGFYSVIWGKGEEEKMVEGDENSKLETTSCSATVPLLQDKGVVKYSCLCKNSNV